MILNPKNIPLDLLVYMYGIIFRRLPFNWITAAAAAVFMDGSIFIFVRMDWKED